MSSSLEKELENLNQKCKEDIKKIRDKYNKLRKQARNKYKEEKSRKKYIRRSIPKVLKNLVWDINIGKEKGVGNCYCCLQNIDSKNFEAGHIIAVTNGGETKLENLKPICSCCNKSMGSSNLEDFKQTYLESNKDTVSGFPMGHPLHSWQKQSNRSVNSLFKPNNEQSWDNIYNSLFKPNNEQSWDNI